MAITKVDIFNFEEEVLKSDKPVLVDFWAEWCGPCKMLHPVVEEISEEEEGIKVVEVNADVEGELVMQYQVKSIPTLLIFKDGELKNRSTGFQAKDDILDMIDEA